MGTICCLALYRLYCRTNFRPHQQSSVSELLLESDYFVTKSDEKIYIDLQDSVRYTDEIEKRSRNDSKLNLTVELRGGRKKRSRRRRKVKRFNYAQKQHFTAKTSSSKTGTATKWSCIFSKISKGLQTCADTNTCKLTSEKLNPEDKELGKLVLEIGEEEGSKLDLIYQWSQTWVEKLQCLNSVK